MTELYYAASNMKERKMNKHFLCTIIVIVGITLGYAIGNSKSAQSCQCDEDCKCCVSCSCSHGEK